ncbi:MAG TPA: PHP domain-containing protein [Gemmatimonadaceae bacterium]|nr:PHP domain-containing protein [Gemmatimonadaceae bacterium]
MDAGQADRPPGEVDLHMHSTASDGSLAPSAVVDAARAAGLSAIALTDHDTLAGLQEAQLAAEPLGIRVVPGVELSAHDGPREIHLLALHVSKPEMMESQLSTFRDARETRARNIVERLRNLGINVELETVMQEAAGGAVGRPHVARALIRGGHVRDSREAFDRYLGAGRPGFIPKARLEIREAIELTHSAGALAIWAHPGQDGRRERVEGFVNLGLDGVEIRHPSHLSEDVKRLAALCDFFGLVPSGGSDWHGSPEGQRTIGCMHIPPAWLHQQDVLAARRNSAEVA